MQVEDVAAIGHQFSSDLVRHARTNGGQVAQTGRRPMGRFSQTPARI
jgi:hypothetical protein